MESEAIQFGCTLYSVFTAINNPPSEQPEKNEAPDIIPNRISHNFQVQNLDKSLTLVTVALKRSKT